MRKTNSMGAKFFGKQFYFFKKLATAMKEDKHALFSMKEPSIYTQKIDNLKQLLESMRNMSSLTLLVIDEIKEPNVLDLMVSKNNACIHGERAILLKIEESSPSDFEDLAELVVEHSCLCEDIASFMVDNEKAFNSASNLID